MSWDEKDQEGRESELVGDTSSCGIEKRDRDLLKNSPRLLMRDSELHRPGSNRRTQSGRTEVLVPVHLVPNCPSRISIVWQT